MFKLSVKQTAHRHSRVAGPRSNTLSLLLAVVALISAPRFATAQELPPGGTTSWDIQELQAIVSFLLFDTKDPAVVLPKGLRFISAREVAEHDPEFKEYLKRHPEHSEWAFSFVEVLRPKTWVIDGKEPTFPENGGIGVWFAPVDHSGLAAEVPKDRFDAVIAKSPVGILTLGLWVPDREYVSYMRARGHHAEYGMVTLVKEANGGYQGAIQVGDLNVTVSATLRGTEAQERRDPFTQVFYEPRQSVERVVVIAGGNVRESQCSATWSKKGDGPLPRGVFVGPTLLVVEGPIKGSAYRVGTEKKLVGAWPTWFPIRSSVERRAYDSVRPAPSPSGST